ncbi:hypothetical protein DL93DRAFT_2172174 [Clavulina sp. PMI_390]|nr:hypothetical protein DL93DRAFT_2172174 [Clavulina sp. PMI_390]
MPTTTSTHGGGPEIADFRADDGPLGLLQTDLRELIYKFIELSVMVEDKSADAASDAPRLAAKVNEIISQLGYLEALRNVLEHKVPIQVLRDIDAVANPNLLTKERIERAAAENQRMVGKMQAIGSYKSLLEEALKQVDG